MGARFPGGMALLARKEETVIAASNFILLPLTFLSSAFMQRDLEPARLDPVGGQVQPGRVDHPGGPRGAHRLPRWGLVLSRTGLLAALCATCTWLATRAFRSYQRSI